MEPHEVHAGLLGICREVLRAPELEIEDSHAAPDIPNYDSLAHIEILVRCQQAFAITLTALEAGQIKTFGQLKDLIRRKVGERA